MAFSICVSYPCFLAVVCVRCQQESTGCYISALQLCSGGNSKGFRPRNVRVVDGSLPRVVSRSNSAMLNLRSASCSESADGGKKGRRGNPRIPPLPVRVPRIFDPTCSSPASVLLPRGVVRSRATNPMYYIARCMIKGLILCRGAL